MLDHIDIFGKTRPWPGHKRGSQEWDSDALSQGYEVVLVEGTGHNVHFANVVFFNDLAGTNHPARVTLSDAYERCSTLQPSIATNPRVFGGKPFIAGTRVPVALVLRYLATDEDPLEDLGISQKDVEDCLEYAALICDYSNSQVD